MNRREALQGLATLASGAGMAVTPVTTEDAKGVELVIVKVQSPMSSEWFDRFRSYWEFAVKDTALQDVKVLMIEGDRVDIEFIRTK